MVVAELLHPKVEVVEAGAARHEMVDRVVAAEGREVLHLDALGVQVVLAGLPQDEREVPVEVLAGVEVVLP